jgi:dihydropteroate synthase
MGIVNVTPDSFSDGGCYASTAKAVDHALALLDHGADLVDVGGESTRPGAPRVGPQEELERVLPVVQGILRSRPNTTISVDTSKALVAETVLRAGARIINDVRALADPAMAATCARAEATVVLMHMRGTPASMQKDTGYDDLMMEVRQFLTERVRYATDAGISSARLVLDPGIGFGKAWKDNPSLIHRLGELASLGCPVLIGASRKRFIGEITGEPDASKRVFGSIGAALAASARGADILRVHDVRGTIQALKVFRACMDGA